VEAAILKSRELNNEFDIGGAPIAPRSHFNLSAMPAAHHKRVGDEYITVTDLADE
jgi:hypothetical protein